MLDEIYLMKGMPVGVLPLNSSYLAPKNSTSFFSSTVASKSAKPTSHRAEERTYQ